MNLTGNFDKRDKNRLQSDTEPESQSMYENEQFIKAGRVRNLCFVQPDKKKLFLNYSYLISGEFSPETNTITLVYTTHEITISGRNLEPLFEKLGMHLQKTVVTVDKRYIGTFETDELVVTSIVIASNK
jgi:hypothetical protein